MEAHHHCVSWQNAFITMKKVRERSQSQTHPSYHVALLSSSWSSDSQEKEQRLFSSKFGSINYRGKLCFALPASIQIRTQKACKFSADEPARGEPSGAVIGHPKLAPIYDPYRQWHSTVSRLLPSVSLDITTRGSWTYEQDHRCTNI